MHESHKILIVEDQSIISTNIKLLLRKSKYEVIDVVSTGEEALLSISSNPPDLVLMDISLPGDMDGIETTEQINKLYDIPIIFLTAHSDERTLDRAKRTSAFSFLTKDNNLNNNLLLTLEFVFYRAKMDKELKLANQKLKDSEELFRGIADAAKEAIFVIDESGLINFWNQGAINMFGFSASDINGKKFIEIIKNDDDKSFISEQIELLSTDDCKLLGNHYEFTGIAKNGKEVPIEMSVARISLKDKAHATGIIRDITERRKFEEDSKRLIEEITLSRQEIEINANQVIRVNDRLSQSENYLRELNYQKDKFISVVAHDLKNPFHGLMGYSEILSKNLDDLEREEILELAQDLHKTSHELFKLLENLLEWSKLQRGIFSNNPQSTILRDLVRLCFDLLSANAKQKEISLKNDVPPDLVGSFDPNIINTIIRNFVSNSIKFTENNGEVKISAYKDGSLIHLTIEDNGVGMEEKIVKQLFDIEHHYTSRGTNSETGSGLGLILCYELLEKINGTIEVDSKLGRGTKFFITFPESVEI